MVLFTTWGNCWSGWSGIELSGHIAVIAVECGFWDVSPQLTVLALLSEGYFWGEDAVTVSLKWGFSFDF
jgi:hypothetical protein